jgi:hypothetical protein
MLAPTVKAKPLQQNADAERRHHSVVTTIDGIATDVASGLLPSAAALTIHTFQGAPDYLQ